MVKCLSHHKVKISRHRSIQKRCQPVWLKKLSGISTISYCIKLNLSKCKGSQPFCTKHNMSSNFQSPSMFTFFWAFHKNRVLKVVYPLNMSAYNISWPRVECFKFFIHLRSLNDRKFGMVETRELKSVASRLKLLAEFHEHLPTVSKVIYGDTQTAWWYHKPRYSFF
jgi:hypothetical protein